jgi:uncharacterized protein YegP (UPF0339 family)
MSRRAKIQIKHSARGVQKWWYVLLGGNGEIMVTSEKFSSRAICRNRAFRFMAVTKTLTWEDVEFIGLKTKSKLAAIFGAK